MTKDLQILDLWKLIDLSVFPDIDSVTEILKNEGCYVGDYEKPIISSGTLSSDARTVKLCKKSLRQLGFTQSAFFYEIINFIERHGGFLLPPIAGPVLRKEYTDQPKGEVLLIATQPFVDSYGDPHGFSVSCDNDDNRRIGIGYRYPLLTWELHDVWVFGIK